MSLFDNIIGRENLQALPPDQQEQARSIARREFFLNTILGGRGLASGFEAARNVIPNMQAAQQRQRMVQAQENAMVPTSVRSGSQLDMLNQQLGLEGDPNRVVDVEGRTATALRRVAGGTGIEGTGLTERGQFNRQFDPTLYAQTVTAAMDPTKPKDILDVRAAAAPRFDPTAGIFTDPFTGRITSSIQTEARTPGVTQQVDPRTGQLLFGAGQGARQAAEIARPIERAQGEVIIGYDFDNQPIIRNAQGVIQSRFEREQATSLGAAAGQVERVFDPVTQTERLVPRTAIVGSGVSVGGGSRGGAGGAQPTTGGAQGGGQVGAPRGAGGFAAGPSASQQILTETTGRMFQATADSVRQSAESAGSRMFNAEEVYNLASELDPNKLTEWLGIASPYLRIIPGVGENMERFSNNFALFNQQYNRAVQAQMAGPAAKGNLNETEVNLFKGSTFKTSDPKSSTKWVSAVEIARADKDAARQAFLEDYIAEGGDPAQFTNAWSQSPRNIRIYNHPKVDQFITEQVRDGLARPRRPGQEPEFLLPPGYRVRGLDRRTGEVVITKPDGQEFRTR